MEPSGIEKDGVFCGDYVDMVSCLPYISHCNDACDSSTTMLSPILVLQQLQILFSRKMFLYLPRSISILCALILSLVVDVLRVKPLQRLRYVFFD